MDKRLYITTNLVNGKVYAGKHHWKEGSTYMGSGYALKKGFEKYGRDKFKIRWLGLKIETPEELDRLEIRLIRLLKFRYGNRCYNIQKGGCGGYFSFYMTDDEKQEVYRKISEGKKRQYANGLTEAQIDGRKKANIKRKETFKDPIFYNNFITETVKKQTITRKENHRLHGVSNKMSSWLKKLKKHNVKHITYELIFPDNSSKIETKTVNEFMESYNTDWNIFSVARTEGCFVFKRRTTRTKHPFPEKTKLYILSEIKECDM